MKMDAIRKPKKESSPPPELQLRSLGASEEAEAIAEGGSQNGQEVVDGYKAFSATEDRFGQRICFLPVSYISSRSDWTIKMRTAPVVLTGDSIYDI